MRDGEACQGGLGTLSTSHGLRSLGLGLMVKLNDCD